MKVEKTRKGRNPKPFKSGNRVNTVKDITVNPYTGNPAYTFVEDDSIVDICKVQAVDEFRPKPDSLWLVVVECRYNVVAVCPSGEGFYIPGQEPCWGFSHVAEWVKEIIPEENTVDNT